MLGPGPAGGAAAPPRSRKSARASHPYVRRRRVMGGSSMRRVSQSGIVSLMAFVLAIAPFAPAVAADRDERREEERNDHRRLFEGTAEVREHPKRDEVHADERLQTRNRSHPARRS